MTIILESPLPILVFGILAEALLAVLLVQTRRGVYLIPMAGVFLLVVGGVVLERWVVTEREEVEVTLDGAVAALNANDLPGVLRYLSPEATHTRQRAQYAMGRVQFTRVSIYGLKITVNRLTSPATAEARFTGVAYFRDRQGESLYDHYLSGFVVQLQLEEDGWRITDHIEHSTGSGRLGIRD